MLARKAVEAGLARFGDPAEIAAFRRPGPFRWTWPRAGIAEAARCATWPPASRASPNWKPRRAAAACCARWNSRFRRRQRRLLEEIAPERIRLPGGRQVRVHYEAGQPPWIASRLQDFFGMRETPAMARGAVPVVVRLLAPNQRPVQTTTDLAGFWQRLYPQVRRELTRRYPKHAWPENPLR